MTLSIDPARVEELDLPTSGDFEAEIRPRYRPVVFRGVVKDWPIVKAGQDSPAKALGLIERYDNGKPTDLMLAPESEKGRFFYSPDVTGFNFKRDRATLTQLTRNLAAMAGQANPIGAYAGAVGTDAHMPGFNEVHAFPLADAAMTAASRTWVGNATQVATHFDLSDNFAVVALGRRRFTLFPPECIGDLYVGPLDTTLAGQPVSMVDPLKPDLERYPNFERAMEHALVADLEPGDALYIPTLWWHHVVAQDPLNILVNYWHNDARQGGGFLALVHAIMAIRDEPEPQRRAWKSWFDHMVFGPDAPQSADHLPMAARGVTGPPSQSRDERMRQFIARILMSG